MAGLRGASMLPIHGLVSDQAHPAQPLSPADILPVCRQLILTIHLEDV